MTIYKKLLDPFQIGTPNKNHYNNLFRNIHTDSESLFPTKWYRKFRGEGALLKVFVASSEFKWSKFLIEIPWNGIQATNDLWKLLFNPNGPSSTIPVGVRAIYLPYGRKDHADWIVNHLNTLVDFFDPPFFILQDFQFICELPPFFLKNSLLK